MSIILLRKMKTIICKYFKYKYIKKEEIRHINEDPKIFSDEFDEE